MSGYRGCFLYKSIGLERILDYAGVGLERFDCIYMMLFAILLLLYNEFSLVGNFHN